MQKAHSKETRKNNRITKIEEVDHVGAPGVHEHDFRDHLRQLRVLIAGVVPDLLEAHLVRLEPPDAAIAVAANRVRDPRPHDHLPFGGPAVQIKVAGDVHVPQHLVAHADAADGVEERLGLMDVAARREVVEAQGGQDGCRPPLVGDHAGGSPLPVHGGQGAGQVRLDPKTLAGEEAEELGAAHADLELRDHVVASEQPGSEPDAPEVAGGGHGRRAPGDVLGGSRGRIARRIPGRREELPCHDEIDGLAGGLADGEADQEAGGVGSDEVGHLVGAGGLGTGARAHAQDGDPRRRPERGGDSGGVLRLRLLGDDAEKTA
ncbi:hypothetical protein SETIT_4G135700v2 [Setaria italica]|uniref:Uncharacterized protein n=1 Tax=Setaria italica TaxID=4555 RepID=A0A368QUC6_SETIT|nr:hypothetical protein SETIT_4G135700v2 [Setaria italica]